MAKFAATWTDTEATDWAAGDFMRYDKFRDQVGQNLEYLKRGGVFSFNVKAYGAVGDGTTDDTTAIQNAITAAIAAGGSGVFFPAGTYKITAALNVDGSNLYLCGEGAASIIKQFTNTASIFNVGSASTQRTGIMFEHLSLAAGIAKTAGAGIAIQNTVYCGIADLNIAGQFRALDIYDKNFGVLLSRSFLLNNVETGIRYTSTGASSATNGLFIEECVVDNPGGTQPTVAGINWINGAGLYAANCELVRQKVGLLINPGTSQGAQWGFFDSVLFDLCSGSGIEVASTSTAAVYGNVFSNCWSSSNDVYGVHLHPAANTFDGMEFHGCRVLNNAGHGWYIGQYCDHLGILGGYAIANSRTTTNTTDGVYVENTTDALSIIGLVSKGSIWGYANNQRYGINYVGTAIDNTVVMSCDLRGNGTGAFNNLPSTGEHRIMGNLGVLRTMPGSEASFFPELASAPAAVANGAVVWAEDNGAGKTRLMARFGTGANQQIAIEP